MENNEYQDIITHNQKIYAPQESFVKNANLTQEEYAELIDLANSNYEEFWGKLARENIIWNKLFTTILDDSKHPFYQWFTDGTLNIAYNCLDQHIKTIPQKTAIIFEADDGRVTKISYLELYHQVCRAANGLKAIGVKTGDRVVIYLPNSIEAVVAMQACARIGAITSVVFSGFSAHALSDRIKDAGAQVIITANANYRGGKLVQIKQKVDEAIQLLGEDANLVTHTLVVKRADNIECNFNNTRDIWWDELLNNQSETNDCEYFASEHPLFILYTSGSTGKPKGVQHSSGGYLLGSILTMKWVFDHKDSDIFWCTADVGWITGHTYLCYGPLAVGATQVVFEGVPTYPDAKRFWQMIERHKVSIFYTAPTALRALIKLGGELPKQFDLSSLRLLGSVGEPINPEVWRWYYATVGNSNCPIVDTWWQTETGCNMLAPIPGITKLKAGSCTFAIPGIMAEIVDTAGNSLKAGEHGYLVIKKPFPSQLRTIWNNQERYIAAYYPNNIAQGKYYLAGDIAERDSNGYFWILGRSDDVINVSGHRLSTMEIESALVSYPQIAEAAVIGKYHKIKGESVCAFVISKNAEPLTIAEKHQLIIELKKHIDQEIGALARPDDIYFVDSLPKTRSGKIMRRLLRTLANGKEIVSDTSTLENPAALDQIKQLLKHSF